MASGQLRNQRPGHTLQATALVHEAYLRLVGKAGDRRQGTGDSEERPDENLSPESRPLSPGRWDSRGHFFAAAAEAMRRILVDQARRKKSQRHGGDHLRMELSDAVPTLRASDDSERILAIHEALKALESEMPRKAELVKLRFFAGMTLEEAAAALGIALPTAKRDWAAARVWLYRRLSKA